MTEAILELYDYLRRHRLAGVLSFVAVTLLLTVAVLRLGYKEDIADFLPVDSNHHDALKVYQDISGANKIFAVSSTVTRRRPMPTAWRPPWMPLPAR